MTSSTSESSSTKAKAKPAKKEKIFHPQSRKAGQLARTQLRQSKLAGQASKRSKKHSSKVNFYGFFYHALPEEGELTLGELHSIVAVWLARHDADLDEERSIRRKGRPKSVKEQKLEEMKLQEINEYRTGMDVPDLTHPANVSLFRKWDQIEVAYVQMLRFIRITSAKPEVSVLSRVGTHFTLQLDTNPTSSEPQAMNVAEAPLSTEPPSRFASTIMAMDGIM
ncbi:hypothetical protein HETIRDRAFT_460001 [Heterobasidion irregulare TC 32-1]|uniref:Translation machinery-associated protein 16 n=1 Tax=Heterobasidion irregulare (strain TC 32-1) TaxID=747525 RepID=W4JZI7_HETIT|nr:uncharacterized protein HETIRDRAFT_460001 [Heterobasidion irregulare TC 32-1]ETW78962.1 hypothetical protein HETIRDRAFT_460001 [Heterobasidion irregulare TC 32-1]